jgi:hypothetical protein
MRSAMTTVIPIGVTSMLLPCALALYPDHTVPRWAGGVLVVLYCGCIARSDVVQ